MIIAIDFDKTFSAKPKLFRAIVTMMYHHGVQPIMVTQRCEQYRAEIQEVTELTDKELPIVFASGKTKKEAAKEAGYDVDIWVDDNPFSVDMALVYRGCQ